MLVHSNVESGVTWRRHRVEGRLSVGVQGGGKSTEARNKEMPGALPKLLCRAASGVYTEEKGMNQ